MSFVKCNVVAEIILLEIMSIFITDVTEPNTPGPDDSQAALDALVREVSPSQGCWSDEDYLWLTSHSSRLIEYTDGRIEQLPMPTQEHQAISGFLFLALHPFVRDIGGNVLYAPLRLRIRDGKFREPDLLLVTDADDPRCRNEYWLGADLVVEVVSPDNPDRDLVAKRQDYAEAGIPEYWIVDPRYETVTVLTLEDDAYVEHGVFGRGETAKSTLLDGFAVDVADLFDSR